MGNNLIDVLDQILSVDESTTNLAPQVMEIEQLLTTCLISESKSFELPDNDELAASFDDEHDSIEASIASLRLGYPYQLSPWQRIKLLISSQLHKKNDLINSITRLLDQYGVDEEFMIIVSEFYKRIDQLFQNENNLFQELEYPIWNREKTRLFHRCVLQAVKLNWSQDLSDQPIQWKISERLENLLYEGSPSAICEGFYQLMIVSQSRKISESKTDTLMEFLVKSNEDMSGNLLDNFYLAKDIYTKLTNDGWEPDHWEIENLPMAIDMYFKFLKTIGINQKTNLGDSFEINLEQALEEYRYNGSPFDSSDDKKYVIVVAPGWTYQEEDFVRPKVREITE